MAALGTTGQKAVGVAAVQLTNDATAGTTPILRGVKLSVSTTGKTYYGFASGLLSTTGFYINGVAEISPAECQYIGDIWLIGDASQVVSFNIVGQVVTIS